MSDYKIDDFGRNRSEFGEFRDWFIVKVVTDSGVDVNSIPKREDGGYSLSIVVNGMEIPAEATILNMKETLLSLAGEKAKEILSERMYEFNHLIESFKNEILDKWDEVREKAEDITMEKLEEMQNEV